jgi:hypothetical protein
VPAEREPAAPVGGLARLLRAALASLALLSYRRFGVVIAIASALCVVGTAAAARLRLDPDIAELLPHSYASVRDVEGLRQRFGGVGYVVVLVEGATPEARRRFADELGPRLEALPTVRYVEVKRPNRFFEDRALWFLDRADLEVLRDRLQARKQWHIERSIIDIDDELPPPVEIADLEARYRQRFEAELGAPGGDYYEDADGRVLAVLIRPTRLASDLDFSKRVVGDVEQVVAEVGPRSFAPDLSVELSGRYKKRVDLQSVLGRDLALTSVLASVLIVAYVALHFRRIGAVVLVLVPLGVGLTVTYGIAGLVFGTLNVVTAFIGAILVGIGIDNGIHMLGRFEEEQRGGVPPARAIRVAFGEAGRISVAAAVTTASAFACLTWTDFRAFREFGLLAALGMLAVVASYVVLLPAMLAASGRVRWPRWWGIERPVRSLGLPGVAAMRRWAPALFWILCVGAVLVGGQWRHARFDADFSRLDDADLPSFRRDREVNAMLGRSQTPMVLLASSVAEAREAAAVVRARMRELGPAATIGQVATLGDLVPEDQSDKAPVMRQIASILSRLPEDRLDPALRDRAARLRELAQMPPFTAEDLPRSLRQVFATTEGTTPAHVVLLFPTVSMGEAVAVRALADQLRHVPLSSGVTLAAAGEPMLLADILALVTRDGPRIVVLTLVLVLTTLWIALGALRLALMALAPALVTLVVTLGLLPLVGLELNYLNMIVIPILLGIGVDDGAHLVARIDAGDSLDEVWRHTGWDITGAIATDAFGFGVLALAEHPGLRGLGQLALLGLSVNLIACVLLLPAALALWPLLGKRRWPPLPELISSVFGAGYSPLAPGTVGALAALPLACALIGQPWYVWLVAIGAVTAIATWAVRRYLVTVAAKPRGHDPQEIVIDETLGCFIALAFVPVSPAWWAAAFILFRVLDVWKPGPIRWIDRHARGALGVLGDDVAAGVLAGLVLLAVQRQL